MPITHVTSRRYIRASFMTGADMKRALNLFSMLILAMALVVPQAEAGVIATDQALQTPSERERVKAMLERPEVAKALQKYGVNAHDAAARVDAMSNEEVAQLAGRLDALPAGGEITNQELLLVIIIILLVALLV
jgi:hypothetical protein